MMLTMIQFILQGMLTYNTVSNFWGLKFLWFGKLGPFCGFIFLWHTYSSHLIIWLKFSKFSWIKWLHEINKHLNPTKITNHMVIRRDMFKIKYQFTGLFEKECRASFSYCPSCYGVKWTKNFRAVKFICNINSHHFTVTDIK